MDNLFEIAKGVVTKEDENKFIEACKKRVACVAKHSNEPTNCWLYQKETPLFIYTILV